jgi:triosephosphate isomerase
VDIVVAPPYLYMDQAREGLNDNFVVAAQNAWVGGWSRGPFAGCRSIGYVDHTGRRHVDHTGCHQLVFYHSQG